MNNKKGLMLLSGILIIIYHFWINLTNSNLEIFLRQLCFIGVDIFFFLSAYSLSKRKIKYKQFIKNRFINIYLIFILFCIINFFINDFKINNLIFNILGISLFIKGGGSFLWFIPSIMIVYLLLPIYKKYDSKKTFILFTLFYIVLVCLLNILLNYNTLNIFLFRIPIILLGYYFSKYDLINKIKYKYIISILLIIFNFEIIYFININKTDYNYLLYIPLILGIIMFLSNIKSNKLIDKLGSITLEMYIIQMTFGYKVATYLYKLINHKLLFNISIIIVIILLSYMFNLIKNIILKKEKKHV